MMSAESNPLENFENAREKLEEIRKMQTQFASRVLNEGIELQQKQYTLFTSIVQNQMEFGRSLFSGALGIINDNLQHSEKKSARNN